MEILRVSANKEHTCAHSTDEIPQEKKIHSISTQPVELAETYDSKKKAPMTMSKSKKL